MQRGSNGRKTKILNRSDIAGKTGTTNDAISTWFSGFHRDLSATVWVGTDDFSSLGDNEFGSSIALPIWVDFMKVGLKDLPTGSMANSSRAFVYQGEQGHWKASRAARSKLLF